MQRRLTLFFLTFATLFASVHVLSLSHDHVDRVAHSHEASHADDNSGSEAAPVEPEAPLDSANISGEVPHQHITPVGLAATSFHAGLGIGLGRSLAFQAPVTVLASRDSAPPLEPPSV